MAELIETVFDMLDVIFFTLLIYKVSLKGHIQTNFRLSEQCAREDKTS